MARKEERHEGAPGVFGPMHKGNAGDQWAEMKEQRSMSP